MIWTTCAQSIIFVISIILSHIYINLWLCPCSHCLLTLKFLVKILIISFLIRSFKHESVVQSQLYLVCICISINTSQFHISFMHMPHSQSIEFEVLLYWNITLSNNKLYLWNLSTLAMLNCCIDIINCPYYIEVLSLCHNQSSFEYQFIYVNWCTDQKWTLSLKYWNMYHVHKWTNYTVSNYQYKQCTVKNMLLW